MTDQLSQSGVPLPAEEETDNLDDSQQGHESSGKIACFVIWSQTGGDQES